MLSHDTVLPQCREQVDNILIVRNSSNKVFSLGEEGRPAVVDYEVQVYTMIDGELPGCGKVSMLQSSTL